MSGTKVNNYAIGDDNIEAVMLTTDQIFKGLCSVSLTEMSTTTVPKIAAGSWIECNGTLFKFDADETLTGSPSDGVVYIRIIPSTDTCTAEMTNTAPTWSDSKQGWYGTSSAANYKYIGGCTKSSTSYTYKFVLIDKNGLGLKYFRDSFSLGILEDLSFKTLTIEDLQMYAIGDIELVTWTIASGFSDVIIIKKPCTVYLKNNTDNIILVNSFNLVPGYYYFYMSSDYLVLHKSHVTSGVSYNNSELVYPEMCKVLGNSADYRISNSGAGNIASLHCIYAEGMSTLDADLIIG